MTLEQQVRSIQTRQDFIAFLEALEADFLANRDGWTNANLSSFLEAMTAWSQDMEGFYDNTGEELAKLSPWRVLADVLMAARIYE
jgi:hypothetical protein